MSKGPGAPRRRTLVWAYAALLGTFLLMAAGLVAWGPRLLASGLGTPLYFFALVPLALGAAGFLHGALGAFKAELEGKLWYGSVRLAGPVAVFGVVLASGVWVAMHPLLPPTFSVLVRVHGPGGAGDLVTEGRVVFDYGLVHQTQGLGPEGAVTFSEIPAKFEGREAVVSFVRPGYAMTTGEKWTLARDQPIALEVARLPLKSRLRGTALRADGQPLAGATVLVDHGAATTLTDANGNFAVDLAVADGTTVEVVVTRDGRVGFHGYLTAPGPHTVKVSP